MITETFLCFHIEYIPTDIGFAPLWPEQFVFFHGQLFMYIGKGRDRRT